MDKNVNSKDKKKSFSIVKKIGITFIIPIFLAILGALLILSVGWNYIGTGINYGTAIFAKPTVKLERRTFEINYKTIKRPITGEQIATLNINSVNLNQPVYQGTSEAQFSIGVGHHTNSTLPGEGGKCVLAAHRDGYFAPLQGIQVGDEVSLQTEYGTYYYKVSNIWIAEKNDKTVLMPADKEMLVMYTCYPFYYIGAAPQRFIVECEFIKVEG